jgi:hypothetical protein
MTMLATGRQLHFPVHAEMPETKRHLETSRAEAERRIQELEAELRRRSHY